MSIPDRSRVVAAVAKFVTGRAVELGARSQVPISGAELVDREAGRDFASLPDYADGSVDVLLAIDALDHTCDRILAIREWRRILKEGGRLILWSTMSQTAAKGPGAPAVVGVLHHVGGFEIVEAGAEPGMDCGPIIAERQTILDVRQPFGVHGNDFADAAARDPAAKAELMFQTGTVLLRSGEPAIAEACFESMLAVEPKNSEGLFGLAMCYGSTQRWADALTALHKVLALDPGNDEARRWVELARSNTTEPGVTAPPAAIQTEVAASAAPPLSVAPPRSGAGLRI